MSEQNIAADEITSQKRTLVSFKDIQIAYLIEGISGVKKLVKGRKNVSPLLRRALKELSKAGKNIESLEGYIQEQYGLGTRGRSVPTLGQERLYKAQKLPAGGPFLRLPLAPLGTNKGGFLRVKFERDRIIVQKA